MTDHSSNDTWPLTAYQRDLMGVASRHPDLPLVQQSAYSHLDTAVDAERMAECVRMVFVRNDAPRLRIGLIDGEFRQWLTDESAELEVQDFSADVDPTGAAMAFMEAANRDALSADTAMFRFAVLIDSADSFFLYARVHHTVADAWAINLIVGQVITDYESSVPADQLAEYRMPSYLDFVERDIEYRESPRWESDRDWLADYLSDVTPALFTRKATLDKVERHAYTLKVDPQLVDRIRDTGLSIFSFTSAVLSSYLALVHAADEIVLGVPMLNRNTPEELITCGDFTNLIPLRVRMDDGPTTLDVATSIAADVRQLKQRQGFAYGDIARTLKNGGPASAALFDVTYSYNRLPDADHLERLLEKSHIFSAGSSMDAVNIVAIEHERDGSLDVHIFYSADVFDTSFPMESAVRGFVGLLRRALDEPDLPIRKIARISGRERQALESWERGPDSEFPESGLDQIFDQQVARTPEAVAVVFGDESLTYRQLHHRACRLAAELVRRGVQPDERVPVVLTRSIDMLVAVYGVLRAGAAYVPIDPGYPDERIAAVVGESGARFAVVAPNVSESAVGVHVERVSVNPHAADPVKLTHSAASPTDLAYVIFTSGSTGKPKGVMVEHRSVVNRLTWMQRRYPLGESDVILQKTPVTFDVSVWELLWWAGVGARVSLLAPGAERDPRRIIDTIDADAVTVMHFVPSMLGPYLDELENDDAVLPRVSSLRRVFCSGEALPAAVVRRFNTVFSKVPNPPQLVNLYGPTEATVDVSYFDCPAGDTELDVVPIGKPIDNISLLILDQDGRRVPRGVAGELNIAGVGVARGYLDRPELTAETFVPDADVPGGRRYRTGDIARWLGDGNIEYLGRRDDQVKVRGNRVTLGEIQNEMLTCPGVRGAAVIDMPSETHGTYLVGYFVGTGVGDGAMSNHLGNRLPAYMVPSRFVEVDEIPLTANGKLDRRALARTQVTESVGGVARNATESALVEVCAQVLGIDTIGVHDNFFTHGGDSILALALRTAAEARGLHIDIDELFMRPTIAELAQHVSDHPNADPNRVSAPFELLPLVDKAALHAAEDAFPITSLQLGMLFHSSERSDSTLYKDVFRYRIAMPWNESAFRDVFGALVDRQPALRTSFDLTKYSVPLQIVHERIDEALSIVDLTEIDGPSAESAIGQFIEQRRHHSYSITDAPLFHLRAYLVGSRVDLVLSFHHAILDGWSVANVMRELIQSYLVRLGFALPPVDDRPRSSTVLAEYANAERNADADPAHSRYWQQLLAGANPTALTSLAPHLPPDKPERTQSTRLLSRALQARVTQFSATYDVPLKAVFLAAHCLALRTVTGLDDVTTGVIGHGRPGRGDAESTAGLFLNTLPMRLDSSALTWVDAVRQVALRERESYPHRRYPLRSMLNDLASGDRTSARGATAFDTAFNFVNYHVFGQLIDLDGVEFLGLDVREETNFSALVTALTDPRSGRMSIRVDGDETISDQQCESLAAACIRMLNCIVDQPAAVVDTGTSRAIAGDVAQLIDDQATRTPDAVAVVSDDDSWTYDELIRRVDVIAARLAALQLAPQARVAVLMDRRAELIATVVAIAKVGAVCVPLDTTYPARRIGLMIERSRPGAVIADAEYRELVSDPSLLLDAQELLGDLDEPAHGDEHGVMHPVISPGAPAYVLFTSGSTGEPKGVTMPHSALTNLVQWQNRTASGSNVGSTMQFAPLSFDVSFQEIFSTLASGATIRLAGSHHRSDVVALLHTVMDEGIERLFLPFVALQSFAEAAVSMGLYPTSLKVLISSGEQLRITPEIRELCDAIPNLILENQYGPTETHVALSYTMAGGAHRYPALPPIGQPIAGASAHLLDERLRPVPAGVEGEIYLGGQALALGYEGRGSLTAQRFVPAGPNGALLYRTGDLGIALESGDIVCRGRADSQVKIRGYRVEPAEVELTLAAAAAQFPGIRESAVLARTFGATDGVLTAFVVGDESSTDVRGLMDVLRADLPAHMVPAHVVWLDSMPRTPSGKRDDKALREIPFGNVARTAEKTPPRDEYESAIAAIMAEFAGVAEIGVDEHFFDVGGTSVGAMRVVLSLNRRWDVEIPLDTFLGAPTAERLAVLVRAGGERRAFDPVVTLQAEGDGIPLFLVHPIGGNVLCYLPLVRYLPKNRPVYALQAAGADVGSEPERSVSAMAKSYIEAIRRVRPEGPYHLGGWSFGGYVAFEMAGQLPDSDVASITLLDTIALRPGARASIPEKDLMKWFFMELLWYARGEGAATFEFDNEVLDSDELFAKMLGEAVEEGILPMDSSPQSIRRLYDIFHANYVATLEFQPSPLALDVTLLRAEEGLPPGVDFAHEVIGTMFDSKTNGWDSYVEGALDVQSVPGYHLRMMTDPFVELLTAKLSAALSGSEHNSKMAGR
ncbi:MAG: amino acid adenylation domain-containing protein [Rhodococcus sp.]|nr:amino acid adenylation domain-containing protein [Rhodococcus sp. (in: high G+C Gram-positive bacteria)]